MQVALADQDSIDVAPGDHDLEVIVGDGVLMKTQVHVASGATKRMVIPDDVMRKIRVAVTDWSQSWHAQEAMLFKVNSSGTGAKGIVANYCNLGVTKASGPDLNQNWGMHIAPFAVA